jgi:hypothetical protein
MSDVNSDPDHLDATDDRKHLGGHSTVLTPYRQAGFC